MLKRNKTSTTLIIKEFSEVSLACFSHNKFLEFHVTSFMIQPKGLMSDNCHLVDFFESNH